MFRALILTFPVIIRRMHDLIESRDASFVLSSLTFRARA